MATVVLLLSDKRSGSTMVQEELCHHSEIRHVEYSPHTYFETHHWLKSAVVLGRPAPLFASRRIYDGYGSRANARAYIVEVLKENIPDCKIPATDEALVFDGWEMLCEKFANPIFFEKSPQILGQWSALSLMIEWMARTKYDVKIIGLVRNPMAVQYSAQELFSTAPERRQFGWLDTQRNLLSLKAILPSEKFEIVRYEDIVSNPKKLFESICKFIGVPYEGLIGDGVRQGSQEKWRLDASYTLQLDPAVRQIGQIFGYEMEEMSNANLPSHVVVPSVVNNRKRKFRNWLNRRRDRLIKPAFIRLRSMFLR